MGFILNLIPLIFTDDTDWEDRVSGKQNRSPQIYADERRSKAYHGEGRTQFWLNAFRAGL
jgi:hypothetical protein